MNSTAQFDVVLFGLDLLGQERDEAKRKLAELIDIPEDQVEDLLDGRGRTIVERVPVEKAREYRDALLAAGFRCNYRPTSLSELGLELVPMSEEERITCPACARIHIVKPGQPQPQVCEKCGIVFTKYHLVAAQKEERDKIRRALLAKHQRLIDENREEQDRREREERERKLEEEIRLELGLPRMLHSRGALISSATVLFALGMFTSAAGLYLYDTYYRKNGSRTVLAAGGRPSFQGITPEMLENMDPAMFTHFQFSGVQPEDLSGLASMAATGSAELPDLGEGVGEIATNPGAARSGVPSLPKAVSPVEEMRRDAEWDLFLLARIESLLKAGNPAVAVQLAEFLKRPEARVLRLAELGRRQQSLGKIAEAERLFGLAIKFAAETQAPAEIRVESLARVVRLAAGIKGSKAAEAALDEAQSLGSTIAEPAAKTIADANIAFMLTRLDRSAEAKAAFQRVKTQLRTLAAPSERLAVLPALASVYGLSGKRSSALMLLEDMEQGLPKLDDPVQKAKLVETLVTSYGELGEIPSALGAIDRHDGGFGRDALRYELLSGGLLRGDVSDLADIPARMSAPAYRARAYALLETGTPAVAGVEASPSRFWLTQAKAAAAGVIDPATKAVLFSELGRIALHSGDEATARAHFAESERLAEGTDSASEKSRLFALIAAHEARALRIADARRNLARITDGELAKAMEAEVSDAAKAAKLLES